MSKKSKLYRRISRLTTVGLSLLPATLATSQEKSGTPATSERPNIIFILADDLGYGDLGCFGSRLIQTPNIDRLAQSGTVFTQAYAGSAVSSPSRCSLLTGRNTGNTTIRDNMCTTGGIQGIKLTAKGDTTYVRRANLLPNDTTLATVLSAAGYRTALVNKWHVDGYDTQATPHRRGFHEFTGWTVSTVHSNSPYYYPYYRFRGDTLTHIRENADGRHSRHNTDISTDDAIAFIERNKEQPFFLYLGYDSPHEPYIIDDTHWYDNQPGMSDTARRYASLITHMDAAIGRLIDTLERLQLRENTLIIFASDNGAAKQAPIDELQCTGGLRGQKAFLYEGGIRVPFIVNQPGRVAVRRLDNLIYFADVMPTLAGLAHAKEYLPKQLDGIDLQPLLTGEEAPVDTDSRLLYWEFPGKQRAARRGDWKCVSVRRGEPLELYNLREDPKEQHNLAEKYPEIVREMEAAMRAERTPSPYWPLADD